MAKKKRKNTGRTAPKAQPSEGAGSAASAPSKPRSDARPFDATVLLLVLSGIGIVLTAYLTGVKLMQGELLACDAGGGCDVVLNSHWSVLLGMPIAAYGLATYALIAFLLWRSRRRPGAWIHAMFVALIGIGVSLYLQAISVFVIDALCPYCIASAALITTIFVLLAAFRPVRAGPFRWVSFGPATGIVAGGLVLVMHLHFSGAFDPQYGPEKADLRGLATHLESSGAKFYGAFWCPHCNQQKELFGASAKRLPYVECSPSGRNGPRNPACTAKAIRSFPTWIINGRRYTGVQSTTELAKLSDYGG